MMKLFNYKICLTLLLAHNAVGQSPTFNVQLPTATASATPSQDDATLYDVTFVGMNSGWAVGDRGTIWKTEDGGNSWAFVPTLSGMERCSFRSVCFLTNQVGWVAGGSIIPFSQTNTGVVLFTRDGGTSWEQLDGNQLPFLKSIQFFDLVHGIAVGERSTAFPSGIAQTSDGGRTWTPINAEDSATWNTGAFFSSSEGIVLGDQGHTGIVANNHFNPGSNSTHGLQGLQGVSVHHSGRCWLVGDGALYLRSQNRGVSWEMPESQLPKALKDFVDLNCVEQKGDHVWIAGSPGSVIWHSADNGNSWIPQPTTDPAPLKSLHFTDDQHGIAVGAFGRISITDDGGQRWKTIRGHGRRLACLALHAHASRPSISFLTRWSKEGGYRVAVSLVARNDLGDDAHASQRTLTQLEQAVMLSGGGHAQIDWRLPLSIPGLAQREDKLVEEWSMLTDRRLPDLLMGNLVAQLRTWKPDVLLIDEGPPNDAATKLIHQAIFRAVQQARDPHYYPEQLSATNLAPWSVKKIVSQRPLGSTGSIQQQPFEILPHLSSTLDLACLEAAACLGYPAEDLTKPIHYQVVQTESPQISQSSIFSDLKITTNSAARRAVPSLTSIDYDSLIAQAKHRRTITQISDHMTNKAGGGAQLLAQIRPLMKSLTREQAAAQLADLALKYRRQSDWALTEATYAELITYYADQPQAVPAMLWLTKFWTSSELNWQRVKTISGTQTNTRNEEALVFATFEKAEEILKKNATRMGAQSEIQQLSSVFENEKSSLIPTAGDLQSVTNGSGQSSSQRMMMLRRRQEMALAVLIQLEQQHPRLFQDDEMQFVVASLMRRRGVNKKSDAIYDRYLQLLNDDPWHAAASGETWLLRPGALSPKPVVNCKKTLIVPVLDGDLSDVCWADAKELKLGEQTKTDTFVGASGGNVAFVGQKPIVMFSHDDKFLYLAASIPIDEDSPSDAPQHGGRDHDADFALRDHLKFQFDVDRDYATYYSFEIDQTGACREACWESLSYDPEWFIASKRDHSAWKLEAAIPLDHLVPANTVLGSTWAIGVTRVKPGIGADSWTDSGAETPNPPQFGFLRFSN